VIYVQIFLLVVSLIVSYALRPKPVIPKPASLDDFDIPMAELGRAVPVVFGTMVLRSPSVIWYGDLRTTAIKKKQKK
jgi:hypothetical protein